MRGFAGVTRFLVADLARLRREAGELAAAPRLIEPFLFRLRQHQRLEESIVLPSARQRAPGLVDRVRREHDEIRAQVRTVERARCGDDPRATATAVFELCAAVCRHEELELELLEHRPLPVADTPAGSAPMPVDRAS